MSKQRLSRLFHRKSSARSRPPVHSGPHSPRTLPAPTMASAHQQATGNAPSDSPNYPRPDSRRSNLVWESLNGPWDFLFDDTDIGLHDYWHKTGLPSHAATSDNAKPVIKRTITVPFVFQCAASHINERGIHEVLWYERLIDDMRSVEDHGRGQRLMLRFGAVDYHAMVWLDGFFVGEHRGGHVPFDVDLSEAAHFSSSTARHRVTVRVFDSATDKTQPRGKQFWGPKPEHIWYTPSSG